ncbi:hypothetical protein FOMPIDRAFT_1053479 [Fomitopsis schrenkii]|uniref:Uncharacterized protein n=1 Tax=Fomitopsis schrenkii TaxID=2126942 RepID=S8F3A3_FOMSC|nr:hypothetical protein FOMPIDRAFT_1053479 [Fomitopsis schrenkii]
MSPPRIVSSLLGPLALGILLASVVFGINCLQAYLYYTTFSRRDSAALKSYVAVLMTTDCVHVVLSIVVYYHYTVDCFGDLKALQSVYWLLLVQVLVGSVLGTMVRQTNHAIHLLVMYALNTCALNTYDPSLFAPAPSLLSSQTFFSILALATLVMFIIYPKTTICTSFWFVLVRVYTCSMLSTLNSRENIRQALESHGLISFPSMEVRRIRPEMTPNASVANVSKWDPPQDERTSDPSSH